jgi:alpha-tubulin suppressor-like RCC1 family protein
MHPRPSTLGGFARSFAVSVFAFCLILLLLASRSMAQCEREEEKSERRERQNNLSLELNSALPRTVSVQVSGPGIEMPLQFQLCVGHGKDGSGMRVPLGKDRQFEIRVLDAQGRATHQGMTTMAVTEDTKKSVYVNLVPLGKPEVLTATIGKFRLDIRQEPSPAKVGEPVSYRVQVFDPDGKAVNIRESDITMRIGDETILRHPRPGPPPGPHIVINGPRVNLPVGLCFGTMWSCGPLPIPIFAGPTSFQAIASGQDFTCALDSGGQAWCWGDDSGGQLGSMFAAPSMCAVSSQVSVPCSLYPLPVAGQHTFQSITAGFDFTCGIDTTGVAWCWGADTLGELGITGGPFPQEVGGIPFGNAHKFSSLSAGGHHACGVTTDQKLFCWGSNQSGELGIGSTNPAGPPSLVNIPGETQVTAVAAGRFHTCAITGDAAMFCWGDDGSGELGIDFRSITSAGCKNSPTNLIQGTDFCMLTPVQVSIGANSGRWDRVSAGFEFTCGRDQPSSKMFCFGTNLGAELGNGSITAAINTVVGTGSAAASETPSPTAVDTNLAPALIASSEGQSCAVPFNISGPGDLVCWGTITGPPVLSPASIPGHTFGNFGPGGDHTCAIDTNAKAWCWGANTMGQLGNNTTTDSLTPVQVVQ